MLLASPLESPRDFQIENGDNRNSSGLTDGDGQERKATGQTQVFHKETHTASLTEAAPEGVNIDKLEGQGTDSNTVSQRKDKNADKQDVTDKKLCRKPKKNTRGIKVPKKKDKDRDKPRTEKKVDFPEPLVKAHQAAYAFLNPSINKYDAVLGLLEEATKTQVSVQPMVAFMALRYEEIIQGLEEMADEGEKVLKENGQHLAWPSQIKNLSSAALQPPPANIEPPPDLLQQLLQYTTQRMRNVSHTVGGIGDNALQEAVAYFASVSELLEEKLKVKRAVESRLLQLLSRIEMASLRKPGPEDSALFSEDSGIGAECESLTGSERRIRRESCASSGTNRTTPVSLLGHTFMNVRPGVSRQKVVGKISPSVSLTSLNSFISTGTIMPSDQRDSVLGSISLDDGDDDEEDNGGMGIVRVGFIKRSNSSPGEVEEHPHRLPPKRIENPKNVQMTLKMKNTISGRIQFVPSHNDSAKTKLGGSPKTSRHQRMDEQERSSRRSQTAASKHKAAVKKTPVTGERRSRSAESIRSKGEDPALHEPDRTKKDLNQRLMRTSKNKAGGNNWATPAKQNQLTSPAQSPAINRKNSHVKTSSNAKPLKDKARHAKQSDKKEKERSIVIEENSDKICTQSAHVAKPLPSPPSSPRPSSGFYIGRNSVKKLIDTFSQGLEGQVSPEVLGPLKGVRKCGVPVLPGLGNVEAKLSAGMGSCRPETTSSEKTDCFDLDSLPPPPLEVLMDNSFESAQSLPAGVADEGVTKVGKSPLLKRVAPSQRLRASVQSVLPSKAGLPQASRAVVLPRADQKGTHSQSKIDQSDVQVEEEPGQEKHHSQQAKNTIQLRQASDSESSSTIDVATNPIPSQDQSADTQHGGNFSVPSLNSTVSTVPPSVVSTQPPATPPISRGRMLPSTPSTTSTLHRRLPSPHIMKRQPSLPTSASSPVNRNLDAAPVVHRMLPSPPVARQNSNSSSSYLLKAPSPPASPRVQQWSRENSSEDSSSTRKISNVRSVFCPASSSLFETQPCPAPRPPEAWTSTGGSFLSRPWVSRGRFPVIIQGPRPFVRRSHSDGRPSLTPGPPGISVAETCGSEPGIYSPG